MSKWDNLRDRLRESNRDLDAEFEQFLNESLSEESVGSPRTKSPDSKRRDFSHAQKPAASAKPWWESSAEDESASVDVQSWFKTPTVKEEDEILEEDEGELEEAKATMKRDPNDNLAETGVSVTMSKDSLDDVGAKDDADSKPSVHESENNNDDDDDKYSYTEPSGSPTPSPSQRRPENVERNEPSEYTETGINTQNELAEKLEFFKQLEEEKSNLDYGKLNKMLDEETSVTDQVKADDLLQATGVDVGNSIFNATETAADVVSPSNEDVNPSTDKNTLKPSMLSKVSLMDSLDSTMGTAHQEKIKQIRHKQIDVPVSEDIEPPSDGGDLANDDDGDDDDEKEYSESFESDVEEERSEVAKTRTGLLDTSGAGELAALQQALEDAHMKGTGDSGAPPALMRTDKQTENEITRPNAYKETLPSSKVNPTVDEDTAITRPVVATTTVNESKGLSSTPTSVSVPLFNQTLQLPPDISSSAQEQPGIILSRNSEIRDPVKPVLGRDDIFPTCQTGFPSGLSAGFELPNEREPPEYAGTDYRVLPENFQIQSKNRHPPPGIEPHDVTEQHGFSLRPVTDVVKTGGVDVIQSIEEAVVEDIFSRNVAGKPDGNVFHVEVSSDEDTPPPESLRNIKSIVRKRREEENKTKPPSGKQQKAKKSSPKVLPRSAAMGLGRKSVDKKGKGGKARSKERTLGDDDGRSSRVVVDDRFGWKERPAMNSSLRRKGMTPKSQKEKSKESPKRQPRVSESPAELMASVESFANYLNSFVHREDHEPRVDERDVSEEDLGTSRVLREQALRKEIEHWQAMWQDERNEKEKLLNDLAQKDKEWNRREQTLSLQYKKEVNDLKQKVFVLESRLKDVDGKKRAVKTRDLKSMSDEELRKLEKEIRDQDQLLTGYQQENERLYEDLKQAQIKAKTAETQMFKENQKLASEVAALKEKLERKEGIFESSGTAAMGAERIHQLHSQLKILKTNEQEMRKEVDTLENEKRKLERAVKNLERERDEAFQRANEALGTNSQTMADIESSHATEIHRLNRKLAWYVENQELLDKDAAMIKQKNEEIKELKELVERLERERGNINIERDKKEKERTGDAKRIQDLERQVREMEQIIKRRYPNSIPALIYAASSAPGDGKPLKSEDSPKKLSGPSYAFLETRVKKLNQELEEREEEWARSFRVLEQKYNAMQLDYENHVTELRRELEDEREKVTSYTRTRARTTSIEKELESLRDKYEHKTQEQSTEIKNMREKHERNTQELNAEIKTLRDALHARKNVVTQTGGKGVKTKRGKREAKEVAQKIDEDFESRLTSLHEVCEQKDRMIEELRATCAQLQHQRQEMLVEKELTQSRKVFQENSQEKMDVLASENRQLREQLSQVTVEMDQQRVRYQASLAEVERIARQGREASHDELCSLKTQHRQEVENIKQDYANQHSRSKLSELTNKIASLEIVIERLKDKLAKSAETEAELASTKVHEEVLQQEIRQLKSDLKKAKQFHTPEMQHYSQLEDKIVAMETRYSRREHELHAIIHNLRVSADVEKDAVLGKWRELLRKKTEETERFRVELEAILSVLEELRQQGVVIPRDKIKHLHYL